MKTKYLSLLILFFAVVFTNCKKKKSCSQWRDGVFELVDDERDILIQREGGVQTETNRKTGTYTKFVVKWTDECTYQLYFLEGDERLLEIWQMDYLEVKILNATTYGYAYEAKFSKSNNIETYEIRVLN